MQPPVPPNLKLGLSKFDCPHFFKLGLLEFKNLRLSNLPNRTIKLLKYYSGRGCCKCSETEWRKALLGHLLSHWRYKAFSGLSLSLSLSLSLLYAGLKLSSSQLAAWAFSRSLGQHPSLTCWFGFLFQMTEMEKGPSSSFYFYLFKFFFISLFPVAFAQLNTYASLFFLV